MGDKTRRRTTKGDADAKKASLRNIVDELSVIVVATGDCCVCDREARADHCSTDDRIKTKKMAAEDLYADGWRVRVVHEYQVRGLVCPECLAELRLE